MRRHLLLAISCTVFCQQTRRLQFLPPHSALLSAGFTLLALALSRDEAGKCRTRTAHKMQFTKCFLQRLQLRNLIKTAATTTTATITLRAAITTNTMKLNAAIRWATRAPACAVLVSVFVFGGICFGPSKNIKSPSQVAAGQTVPPPSPSLTISLSH